VTRRRAIALVVVLGLTVGGWRGWAALRDASRTPAQAAADARPPQPRPVTAAVERRVLHERLQLRGEVGGAATVEVHPTAPEDRSPIVTALPVAAGTALREGELVLAVAGRPVILLQSDLPLYRDLGPGDSGPDVAGVQRSLGRLGRRIPRSEAGTFGAATQAGIAAVWRAAGYEPTVSGPTPEDPTASGVRLLRAEVATVTQAPATVTAVAVRLGGTVDPAVAAVTLADGGLVVRVRLDGPQASLLQPGQDAALGDVPLTVVRIEPPADSGTAGSGTAVLGPVALASIDPALAGTNQAVEIDLATGSPDPVLAVPITALRSDGNRDYVVVDDGDRHDRRVEVGAGETAGGWVEVRTGDLHEGDRVVVRLR
jgi:hypothetical protein